MLRKLLAVDRIKTTKSYGNARTPVIECLFGGRSYLRVDFLYGSVFFLIAVAIASLANRGGSMLFAIWPSMAFLVVSVAYFTGNVWFFGKRRDGSRHWLSTLALLPYLAFVQLVWRMQIAFSSEPPAHAINDRLLVSRRLLSHELPSNVSMICDLTSEFRDPYTIRTSIGYISFPILDAGVPTPDALIRVVLQLQPAPGTRVLIHCANGHGRTGLVASAWLLAHDGATSSEEALKTVQAARPGISLRKRQRQLLDEVQRLLQDIGEQSGGLGATGTAVSEE